MDFSNCTRQHTGSKADHRASSLMPTGIYNAIFSDVRRNFIVLHGMGPRRANPIPEQPGLRHPDVGLPVRSAGAGRIPLHQFDSRGHGRSDQPDRGYDYDTFADDVAALVSKLDLDRVTLVGHSMAGGEVVRYLTRHGHQRVARIILIASTTPMLLKTDDNPSGVPMAVFEALWVQWQRIIQNGSTTIWRHSSFPETSRAMLQWGASLLQTSVPIALACSQAMVEEDFRAEMRQIEVPALLIHGDRDHDHRDHWKTIGCAPSELLLSRLRGRTSRPDVHAHGPIARRHAAVYPRGVSGSGRPLRRAWLRRGAAVAPSEDAASRRHSWHARYWIRPDRWPAKESLDPRDLHPPGFSPHPSSKLSGAFLRAGRRPTRRTRRDRRTIHRGRRRAACWGRALVAAFAERGRRHRLVRARSPTEPTKAAPSRS